MVSLSTLFCFVFSLNIFISIPLAKISSSSNIYWSFDYCSPSTYLPNSSRLTHISISYITLSLQAPQNGCTTHKFGQVHWLIDWFALNDITSIEGSFRLFVNAVGLLEWCHLMNQWKYFSIKVSLAEHIAFSTVESEEGRTVGGCCIEIIVCDFVRWKCDVLSCNCLKQSKDNFSLYCKRRNVMVKVRNMRKIYSN